MDTDRKILLSHHIKPDYGFYIQSDDRLFVAAYSSVASLVVRFSGYFLDARGEVNHYAIDVAPTSDRAVTSELQIFGEGFLLSCTAHLLTGNANRGQCYVRARIQRGTGATLVPIAQVLGGYVTDDYSPSFPYGKIEGPLEGPGMLRSVTGTDPAAGVELAETVPTGARWRLCEVRFTFTADATVTSRRVRLGLDDGTNLFRQGLSDEAHTAGNAFAYSAGNWGATQSAAGGTKPLMFPLPADLLAGWRMVTATINLQAGDNYSAPQMMVEEWIEA